VSLSGWRGYILHCIRPGMTTIRWCKNSETSVEHRAYSYDATANSTEAGGVLAAKSVPCVVSCMPHAACRDFAGVNRGCSLARSGPATKRKLDYDTSPFRPPATHHVEKGIPPHPVHCLARESLTRKQLVPFSFREVDSWSSHIEHYLGPVRHHESCHQGLWLP
jgi:hypothetical protein